MTWEILSTRHSRERVIADLQASDGTKKTVVRRLHRERAREGKA